MTTAELTALRDELRQVCNREPRGSDHVAFARTYFDMAIFHLRVHAEKLAVLHGERQVGESQRSEAHAG
jgi:hypothetical protein